jgi:hypothetical protein
VGLVEDVDPSRTPDTRHGADVDPDLAYVLDLVCEAASSSTTSIEVPAVMPTHELHTLQGSPPGWRSAQLIALARMRAVVVFPVPRGPANR